MNQETSILDQILQKSEKLRTICMFPNPLRKVVLSYDLFDAIMVDERSAGWSLNLVDHSIKIYGISIQMDSTLPVNTMLESRS